MSGKNLKRILIVAAIAVVIAVFWIFDLGQYLSLSYIKESQERFQVLYEGNRALVIGGYMAVYVLVTSLSLPGAAVMTLAGGALFGLLAGTVIVSFASTIGATIACFVARFLLRDWVQGKLGKRLRKINEGVEREGALYLFTLRLIPVFPFWAINLGMALTRMRLLTFYLVSQVGMLPGTVVYVNAGKQLGEIESAKGILSPGLILSFALIGVFPLVVKKLMGLYRARKGKPQIT